MATVLIIDDEDALRDVVDKRLKLEGHQVISYSDAGPALSAVDFDTIDLIILDLVMPTPGDQAIETIRNRGIEKPIIVLSGNLRPGDEERLTTIGASTVLAKPFRLMGLLTTIEDLLSAA